MSRHNNAGLKVSILDRLMFALGVRTDPRQGIVLPVEWDTLKVRHGPNADRFPQSDPGGAQ